MDRACKQEREDDRRREMLAGLFIGKELKNNPDSEFSRAVRAFLDRQVHPDRDRALFGLGPWRFTSSR